MCCHGNNIVGFIWFFCDVHLWCQVWRTLLQYFWRYIWLSILMLKWNYLWHHHFPRLHNTKNVNISKTKKRYSKKENTILLFFSKAFQISGNHFLLHRHFNGHLPYLREWVMTTQEPERVGERLNTYQNGSVEWMAENRSPRSGWGPWLLITILTIFCWLTECLVLWSSKMRDPGNKVGDCQGKGIKQGSKFIFGFGSTCATRCKFLGALPKF